MIKVAVLDDYQNVFEEIIDIENHQDKFEFTIFNEAFESNDKATSVTFENVTFAIAAFERTITANNTPFDEYTRGNHLALTKSERKGLNLFRSLKTRCFECHNFPTFNNPDFKAIGVPHTNNKEPDLGRAEIVGKGYENAFKVPTLRNIALTAPYMHNGIFKTLDEVVDFYECNIIDYC